MSVSDCIERKCQRLRVNTACFRVASLLVGLNILCYALETTTIETVFGQQIPESWRGTRKPLRFEIVLMGRALKAGADFVSFARYRSADGVEVERRIETYSSAALARKEFKKLIKAASEVLERSNKGKEVEKLGDERAVLRRNTPTLRGVTVIIWTDGRLLYALESTSKHHVSAFEDSFYPKG